MIRTRPQQHRQGQVTGDRLTALGCLLGCAYVHGVRSSHGQPIVPHAQLA